MLTAKQEIKDLKVFVEIGRGVIERFMELAGTKFSASLEVILEVWWYGSVYVVTCD